MGFHPATARHAAWRSTGAVDYRLERQRVLTAVDRGRVARAAVCDAHPELLRVARNAAPATDEICPVCEDAPTRRVSYVFGPRLPAGGKVCTSPAEIARIARRRGEFTGYEVEVCPACGWNHLLRRFPVGDAAG